MLFAHWLYIIAAFLNIIGGGRNEAEENVYIRGQAALARRCTAAQQGGSGEGDSSTEEEVVVFFDTPEEKEVNEKHNEDELEGGMSSGTAELSLEEIIKQLKGTANASKEACSRSSLVEDMCDSVNSDEDKDAT